VVVDVVVVSVVVGSVVVVGGGAVVVGGGADVVVGIVRVVVVVRAVVVLAVVVFRWVVVLAVFLCDCRCLQPPCLRASRHVRANWYRPHHLWYGGDPGVANCSTGWPRSASVI
jgi:hypothetical protein